MSTHCCNTCTTLLKVSRHNVGFYQEGMTRRSPHAVEKIVTCCVDAFATLFKCYHRTVESFSTWCCVVLWKYGKKVMSRCSNQSTTMWRSFRYDVQIPSPYCSKLSWHRVDLYQHSMSWKKCHAAKKFSAWFHVLARTDFVGKVARWTL
jgi:hypothetical protein